MTDRSAADRIRMTVPEGRALGEAVMRGAGYDEDEAHPDRPTRWTRRQAGVKDIRIPDECGYRTRAWLTREGIEIDRKIYDALGRLAEGKLEHGG